MPWTKHYIDTADLENILAKEGLRGITYREAIREALEQLLGKDNSIFILGEGVDDPVAIFGTTLGLCEKFGKERIIDIPIAENGLTGIAIGAAIAGMKPIFVHMRMDFLLMSMDQIVNHAAKWFYMTGGKVNIPLVIRSIIGRGWGSAAQHSQALHSLFTHIPGLKVVMPATPYDAKGLLIAAVNDGNPVLFCEHRWIYDYVGYVPQEMYEVPIGQGQIRKVGNDVTVVAISQMLYDTIKAAKILKTYGVDVEIIDPRTLKPLDENLILSSVKKTGRLVIADVGCKTSGISAEIIARIVEKEHAILKAPIERVCLPDTPTPASPSLEKNYYPTKERIIESVEKVMGISGGVKKVSILVKSPEIEKFDVSVIMPVLNEEENIQAAINNTFEGLEDYYIRGEIVVVNDGSTDNTETLIKEIMKKDSRVRMLKHNKPQGMGVSFWQGVDNARGDTIVMLPGNNTNYPWEIFRYHNLLSNVDMVIPFVFNKEVRPFHRNLLSYIYCSIINFTFSVNFNYTNGRILYRKSLLNELKYRSQGFFFETDILIRAVKKGYLFAEVPYKLAAGKSGDSKGMSFPSFSQVINGYFSLLRDHFFKKDLEKRKFFIGSASERRYRE